MKKLSIAVLALMLALGAACGDDDKSGDGAGGTTQTTTELTGMLPADIIEAGEIKIGSDIAYPPVEFFKEGTNDPEGIDIDIGTALGEKLGVKVTFINDSDFAGIISALKAGRYDAIMSSMNDTDERRNQGVDFVDYFSAGTGILVAKGNPQKITSLADLCGEPVAVQKGTAQETETLPAESKKCTDAGKGAINILAFEGDPEALQQVKIGRAVAIVEDSPVASYNAKTSGGGADFEVVGDVIDVGNYGIAVPSENTKLRDALQAALKAIIADGTYDKILEKWGVSSGALKTATINGA
ncbi:MAG: polar amino acid transport system substrate-binding protein [Actinomycetota bacterium]|jgi:polar amino acid transport system substrate-binding protein